ncbi:hypothetical protein OQA88_4707 [Cercophora sp. LCS_1]
MSAAATISTADLHCCPNCGSNIALPPLEKTSTALLIAEKQIADLQAQVRLLNQKATAAVDRWADYEDELTKLRAELEASRQQQIPQTPPQTSAMQSPTNSWVTSAPATASSISSVTSSSPARSSFLSSGAASRLSSLLSPRKSTPNLKPQPLSRSPHPLATPASAPFTPATPLSPAPSTEDLLEALTREQTLRLEAEGKLNETSREVEELSVSLFEQANEMVATERRARARLEERVEMLEQRDRDKKVRLDKLEGAVGRIERVRKLLGQEEETPGVAVASAAERRSI